MITATARPADTPLNSAVCIDGRYQRQCVRCGRRWEVQMSRPVVRGGMCVDCFEVDPTFGENPRGVQ